MTTTTTTKKKPKKKPTKRWVVEVRTEPEGLYQRELVRCGRAWCTRCHRKPTHGPYWYLYQWQPKKGGRKARLRTIYVGKEFARRVA